MKGKYNIDSVYMFCTFRIDFNIKGESGNYDHWKYSVEYSEFLPKLSFIHHVTHAHFEVKPEGDSFIIRSNHSTCFLHGTVCCKYLILML